MKRNLEQSGPFIGVGGLAVALFLYGYSAIAAPSIVNSVLLPMFWLVLFVVACVWFTRHPVRAIWLPVIAVVVWFATMLLV
ncbi:MAG: hypothetical protein ACXWDI_11930 [Nocardioides sp.]